MLLGSRLRGPIRSARGRARSAGAPGDGFAPDLVVVVVIRVEEAAHGRDAVLVAVGPARGRGAGRARDRGRDVDGGDRDGSRVGVGVGRISGRRIGSTRIDDGGVVAGCIGHGAVDLGPAVVVPGPRHGCRGARRPLDTGALPHTRWTRSRRAKGVGPLGDSGTTGRPDDRRRLDARRRRRHDDGGRGTGRRSGGTTRHAGTRARSSGRCGLGLLPRCRGCALGSGLRRALGRTGGSTLRRQRRRLGRGVG
jgi:hypothetical protein